MQTEINNQLELALVQTEIYWENIDENLRHFGVLLSELPQTTDLVILPEAFTSGFSMDAKKVSQALNGKAIIWMQEIAAQKNIALCGSMFVIDEGKFYNRFVWANPTGELNFYDKRHLFSIEKENVDYENGKSHLLIDFKGWKIFPQICYDLRFPVWARNTHGYDLMINVANWPAARRNVWRTLLQARAIENQCYVAAVNRLGIDGNQIDYVGDSMIINYKGEIKLDGLAKKGLLIEKIDRNELNIFRKKFNTLIDSDRFTIHVE
jgi:predicted amidohydrolase